MSLREYLGKMRGATRDGARRVSRAEVLWSWLGAFLGIGAVSLVSQMYFGPGDMTLVIGSFGAAAVLVYGAIESPLAQPRNLLGGHVISAAVGVTCWQLLHDTPALAVALAVATAIAAMQLTRTLHPPGGATALIAVLGSEDIHRLGYFYIVMPATVGPLVLLAVALLVNNMPRSRRYPVTWN